MLILAQQQSSSPSFVGLSTSRDTVLLANALARIADRLRNPKAVPLHLDLELAGTSLRFLTAYCAAQSGLDVILSGSARMHQRPIAPLVEALRELGATVQYQGQPGCPPLRIQGTRLRSTSTIALNCQQSSQFLSALLLIAPNIDGGLQVHHGGGLVSSSYLQLTLHCLKFFGYKGELGPKMARFIPNDNSLVGDSANLHNDSIIIDGDASAASYYWSLAAVSEGNIWVDNIRSDSVQGDYRFADILAQMGCQLERQAGSTLVCGTKNLRAVQVDMIDMPDSAQTLAVVAACANGLTRIEGLQTLRLKETDRLQAMVVELNRCGIIARCGPDWLEIEGGQPHAACCQSYGDHRMAMSMAVLAARVDGMCIENPEVVAKSQPEFWQTLASLGIRYQQE